MRAAAAAAARPPAPGRGGEARHLVAAGLCRLGGLLPVQAATRLRFLPSLPGVRPGWGGAADLRSPARVGLLPGWLFFRETPNRARTGPGSLRGPGAVSERQPPVRKRCLTRLGPYAWPVLCLGERGGFRNRYAQHPVEGLSSRGEERRGGSTSQPGPARTLRFGASLPRHRFFPTSTA